MLATFLVIILKLFIIAVWENRILPLKHLKLQLTPAHWNQSLTNHLSRRVLHRLIQGNPHDVSGDPGYIKNLQYIFVINTDSDTVSV